MSANATRENPLARLRRAATENPIMAKELRGRMRGFRSTLLLTIYLIVICGLALLIYAISRETSRFSSPLEARVGQYLFFGIVIFQTGLVALLSPAFTAGIITGEREKQTYDLLMTTLLKPRTIIAGKLGAALAWLVLLVLAVVPLEALAYVFGGVAPEEIILATIVLLFAALFYGAIGLFWSTIARSTVAATVLSYATVLFFIVIAPALWALVTLFATAASGNSNASLTDNALWIYGSGIWLCTNPFIAMSLSQTFLSQDRPLFFFVEDKMFGSNSLLLMQPWLYFCIFAAVASLLLMLWAVRVLPPTRRRDAPRHVAPVLATPTAIVSTAPTPTELLITPTAEHTLAQREEAGIEGEVRLRDEQRDE